MKFTVPIKGMPKIGNPAKDLSNGTLIDTLTTKKRVSIPAIIQKSTPKVERDIEQKSISYSDKVIPNMYLDAEYECIISELTKKDNSTEKVYTWKMVSVPNVKYKYPLCKFYVDSEGDLYISAKIDGIIMSDILLNDDNLMGVDESADTTTTRKHNSKIDIATMTEICTLSYGDFMKLFSAAKGIYKTFKGFDMSIITQYDRRDYVRGDNDKTGKAGTVNYNGALFAHNGAEQLAVNLIKEIAKISNSKSIVFTYPQ